MKIYRKKRSIILIICVSLCMVLSVAVIATGFLIKSIPIIALPGYFIVIFTTISLYKKPMFIELDNNELRLINSCFKNSSVSYNLKYIIHIKFINYPFSFTRIEIKTINSTQIYWLTFIGKKEISKIMKDNNVINILKIAHNNSNQ